MICLACGDCCYKLVESCPYIDHRCTFVMCDGYKDRPQVCRDYSFSEEVCPVGIEVLKLKEEDIETRISLVKSFIKYSGPISGYFRD
jgi:uncharacterized cysteine cluster protein YcgN (CxxCxxCC family)